MEAAAREPLARLPRPPSLQLNAGDNAPSQDAVTPSQHRWLGTRTRRSVSMGVFNSDFIFYSSPSPVASLSGTKGGTAEGRHRIERLPTSTEALASTTSEPGGVGVGGAAGGGVGVALRAVVFGLINAVVLVPIMVGFAQIIFRDPFFEKQRPILVKLVLFSSFVHQTAFGLTSSLSFAVGQVQDAGLIFLSRIAASCVSITQEKGATEEETIATTLVVLSIATTLLGVALMLTGYFRLASLVQYLPQPVVGGYLAFIGQYCGEAGLGMMAGVPIDGLSSVSHAFEHGKVLFVLPGLGIGICLYLILKRFHHFAVLPSLLVAIPVGFFMILAVTGTSLQHARDSGWVDTDTSTVSFWRVWELFKFGKVHWGVLPAQLGTWFAMYFVVAFSSCLDVAAIQLDLGKQLDFNHELKTVGFSNIASGLTGGYTGSYIFSQTIFTMRTGLKTRMVGLVIVCCELGMFALPFSVLAYVPRLFFGCILTFIAVDLIIDHLVMAWRRMLGSEYALVLLTFVAINIWNLQEGMLVGIVLAALHFVLQYSSKGAAAQQVAAQSRAFRGYAEREALDARSRQMVVLRLSGHIFFGSAVRLLDEVKRCVVVRVPSPVGNMPVVHDGELLHLDGTSADVGPATRFLVLDFAEVSGLDVTAACTCFLPLVKQLLPQHGIGIVLTSLTPRFTDILRRQGVLPPTDMDDVPGAPKLFASLDLGLEHCEEALLHGDADISGIRSPANGGQGLARVLQAHVASALSPVAEETLCKLEPYFERLDVPKGYVFFGPGDAAEAMFVLEGGEVWLTAEPAEAGGGARRIQRYVGGGIFGDLDFFLERSRSCAAAAVVPCVAWRLQGDRLALLIAEEPCLSVALHRAVLRSMCLSCSGVLNEELSTRP